MEQTNLRGRFTLIAIVGILLLWALVAWGVRLGPDLEGGTTLRFSLDLDRAMKEGRIEIDSEADRNRVLGDTIRIIRERIDRHGLSETGLTPLEGRRKKGFEIQLPAGSEGEVESIKQVVTSLGDLWFRMEVLPAEQYTRDRDAPRLANKASYPWQGTLDSEREDARFPGTAEGFNAYKELEVGVWKTARDTNTPYKPSSKRYRVVPRMKTEAADVRDFVVLEEPKKDHRFDGGILKNPTQGKDPQTGKPVVLYDVKTGFQNMFGEWTGLNVGLPMAIILNEEYRSAPVINGKLETSVQITLGSGPWSELEKEAEELTTVLQTGSLKVRPTLESMNKIGAKLAGASKDRGILAVIVALGLVLVFMVIYYRAQGLVANLALLLNLVLLVGTLAFFQAVLTLPGIAGIVLTLGMAVDANILICERIREERNAGRSLQRAVSEGYDRALTTIVDANMTSLITAIFLYAYGSGPVRGFAITLAIGLIVSMFTAIFVTRTVNEWLMRIGLFREINMLGTGRPPQVSWVALRRIFAPLSVLGVVFGLLVFATEDKYTLYDVDFTGGFKLQARFEEPTSVDEVKRDLRTEKREVEIVTQEFNEAEEEKVEVRRRLVVGPYPMAEVVAVGAVGEGVSITVQRGLIQDDVPEEEQVLPEIQAEAFKAYVRQSLEDRLRPLWLENSPREYKAPEGADEELTATDGGMMFTVTLLDPDGAVTPERLRKGIAEEMPFWVWGRDGRDPGDLKNVNRTVVVRPVEDSKAGLSAFYVWMKSVNTTSNSVIEKDPVQLRKTLAEYLGGKLFKATLTTAGVSEDAATAVGLSEPFPSVDVIGPEEAQRLKNDAIIALALSLLGIILYIAFRFSSRSMGFAAVLCLFHDVAITLGIVAVANMFGLVDAKINLPMVAAFLTLVGYSVNDTVVIFDRIRENRGKKRVITAGMIDLSINQTLARTIKTSVTFLLVCVALFAFNVGQRNVLEGFAFLLIIGALIGTYSTVAIASPLLLFLPWLWERERKYKPRFGMVSSMMKSYLTVLLVPVVFVLYVLWGAVFVASLFLTGLVMFPVWALTEKREAMVVKA